MFFRSFTGAAAAVLCLRSRLMTHFHIQLEPIIQVFLYFWPHAAVIDSCSTQISVNLFDLNISTINRFSALAIIAAQSKHYKIAQLSTACICSRRLTATLSSYADAEALTASSEHIQLIWHDDDFYFNCTRWLINGPKQRERESNDLLHKSKTPSTRTVWRECVIKKSI